jgi:alcohol dehydrogenase (NADP+)
MALQPDTITKQSDVSPARTKTRAYAALSATSDLQPFSIERRPVGPPDVQIDIQYCGICHSDLHAARNEWESAFATVYPCVPGHEIVGRVTKVGSDVTRFREGDVVGVGCMVDSCRQCQNCREGLEQFCEKFPTLTYNTPDKHLGGVTYGGYSKQIVVDEAFVLRISDKLNLAAAAPLLCAGITTYSPLRHWGVEKGQKVGIVGLGGLGHMGLKFAHAFGANVVLFTTSAKKVADGKRLGADEVIISSNTDQMQKHAGSFDFILDTVSATHDVNQYLNLLKRDGTMTLVGAPEQPLPVAAFPLLMGRRTFAGSMIGGIPETQEMLDFCAEHDITSDIELIDAGAINQAYARLLKQDVKYRFVIDTATL